MAKNIRSFTQFVNEQAEVEDSRPLKGYTADQIIGRINDLMDVLADSVRFGVPSDTLGRATTYRDANGAIQKIKDMQHYYASKNEEVRFYCWSISYSGSWKASKTLRTKIESAGGFGEDKQNLNLKKVIEYFTENSEDSDNVASISISMDSESIRKAMRKEEAAESPKPEAAKAESTETKSGTDAEAK